MKTIKLIVLMLLFVMTSNAWAAKWSYSGGNGPRNWALVSPAYGSCTHGQQQSPVNLTHAAPLNDAHLSLHYKLSPFDLRETTHNLYQDNTQLGKNYVVYNGQKYNLVEIHFHVPSEHRLNGFQYPMEAHLVHLNAEHQLLVLGIFFQVGDTNDYLSALLNSSQFQSLDEEVESPVNLNPSYLIPDSLRNKAREYYVYQGSLTTPPCAEGVRWIVAKDPAELSLQQLKSFKAEVSDFNSRPVQPLADRPVNYKS